MNKIIHKRTLWKINALPYSSLIDLFNRSLLQNLDNPIKYIHEVFTGEFEED